MGPQGWGWQGYLVDRDRDAAQHPAVHRADPTTKNDQAQTSTAPRCRKPGLTVWQVCKMLVLVAQAGKRLLPGMPAPPPGRTWCFGQRPKSEPLTDRVGRGPLRCPAGLMEAEGGANLRAAPSCLLGTVEMRGRQRSLNQKEPRVPWEPQPPLEPRSPVSSGEGGGSLGPLLPQPCPSAGRWPGHRALRGPEACGAAWLPPPGRTQRCPHFCSVNAEVASVISKTRTRGHDSSRSAHLPSSL